MSVPGVTLRPCVAGDEDALALVGAATFLESYAGLVNGQDLVAHARLQHAPAVYAAWLGDGHSRLWIASVEPGAAPVGYLVLTRPDLPVATGPDDLEVKRIYVLGRFRQGGVGRQLMDAAAAQVQGYGGGRLLLGVYVRNATALAFYERYGFVQVGTRRFHVGEHHYDDFVLGYEVPRVPG
jgi:ribosomal protein S18 acetylase RimI-like enzyme